MRRLRAAGAVVIGKTNVPELCILPWTESPTCGVTRNPWNLQRSPGGSSGGSAAAVAAGLVGAALAADGGGSIRIPAAWCGLFGLKPQRGRVPLAPRENSWHGLSVNGVLTRSVRDSALFHDAIADGPADPGEPALAPRSSSTRSARDPTRLRIAVSSRLPPSPLTRLAPDNRAALEETARLLRSPRPRGRRARARLRPARAGAASSRRCMWAGCTTTRCGWPIQSALNGASERWRASAA